MIENIKEAIEDVTGVSFDLYSHRCRKMNLFYCRMIFTWHCMKLNMTLANIGLLLNNDHTMSIYYIKKYKDDYKFNSEFKKLADKINELIKK